MAFPPQHEIYKRRLSRNVGLGLTLVAFIVLVFGLTVVKVTQVGQVQGFDHVVRPELVPPQEAAQ